jgi:hypothetical protein
MVWFPNIPKYVNKSWLHEDTYKKYDVVTQYSLITKHM